MSRKLEDRIKRLERRAIWIEDRAVGLQEDSFDAAEASAIRWAVPILREYVRTHEALSSVGGSDE